MGEGMSPPGVQDWVVGAGKDALQDTRMPQSAEVEMVAAVGEKIGLPRDAYQALIMADVATPETAALQKFDDDARGALGGAEEEVVQVVSFIQDRQALQQALQELQGEIPPSQKGTFDIVKGRLEARMRESAEVVAKTVIESEPERQALVGQAVEAMRGSLGAQSYEIGDSVDLTARATDDYTKALGTLLGPDVSQTVYPHARAERYMGHWNSQKLHSAWVAVCAGVAGDKVERAVMGRELLVRSQGYYDKALKARPPRGLKFGAVSNAVLDHVAQDLRTRFNLEGSILTRDREVELTLNATADGLVQGSYSADQLIQSSDQIASLITQSTRDFGVNAPENKYVQADTDATAIHAEAFATGYISGLLNRADVGQVDVIAAMNFALNAVADTQLRATVIQSLTEQYGDDPERLLAIAIASQNPDMPDIDPSRYQHLAIEVGERQSVLSREAIRARFFASDRLGFIGDPSHLDVATGIVTNSEELFRYRAHLMEAVLQKEASFVALQVLMQIDGATPNDGRRKITWDDLNVVVAAVDRWRGFTDKHRLESILNDKTHPLDADQQRMVAMLYFINKATRSGGRYFEDKAEIIDLSDRGLLTAQDIITAHNAAIATVDGLNASSSNARPGEQTPFIFTSFIEGLLAEGKPDAIRGSGRAAGPRGPFKGNVYLYQASVAVNQVGKMGTGVPYYFVGSGHANDAPVYQYALDNNYPAMRLPEARDFATQRGDAVLGAVQAYSEAVAVENVRSIPFADIRLAKPADVGAVDTLLEGSFAGSIDNAARAYGWDMLDLDSGRIGVEGLVRDIQDEKGLLAGSTKKMVQVLNACNLGIGELDELEFSLRNPKRQGLAALAKGAVDKRDFDEARGRILTALADSGIPDGALRDLRRLDLTKYDNIETLREALLAFANQAANTFETTLTGIPNVEAGLQGRYEQLPDLTEQVVAKRILPDGTVLLPTVKTRSVGYGPQVSVELQRSDILALGMQSGSLVLQPLLNEADIAARFTDPVRVAAESTRGILNQEGPNNPFHIPYRFKSPIQTIADRAVRARATFIEDCTGNNRADGRARLQKALEEAWQRKVEAKDQIVPARMATVKATLPSNVYGEMAAAIKYTEPAVVDTSGATSAPQTLESIEGRIRELNRLMDLDPQNADEYMVEVKPLREARQAIENAGKTRAFGTDVPDPEPQPTPVLDKDLLMGQIAHHLMGGQGVVGTDQLQRLNYDPNDQGSIQAAKQTLAALSSRGALPSDVAAQYTHLIDRDLLKFDPASFVW